ncbi:Folliculin-interacting protein 2 [Dissophora globulifera]|nr:Folliculin-interacting protein 2 [Dissophora globulifera]
MTTPPSWGMLKFFSKGSSAKDLEEKHTRELLEQEWHIRVLMCQEVGAIQDVVLFDSRQVAGADFNPPESPSPSPAKGSFKSSSMSSLFGSLRIERSLPSNLSGSQTLPSRRPQKLIPSIVPKLMFGTTPLAYKGSSTKIHLLNEPAQIMLTKTFSIHPTDVMAYTAASTRRGSFSSSNSTSTVEVSGMSTISGHGDYRSHPRASRPMTAFIPESAYTSSSRDDSKNNGAVSSSLPNSSNVKVRTPRPGFDARRMRRASQTSMENGTFNPMPLPSSFSHLDSLGNAKPALTQAARPKSFSIAVFIEVNSNTRLREFIFSHFALIETRLHHLQALCLELLLPICRRMMNAKAGLPGTSQVRAIPDLGRLSFQQDPRLQEAVARLQQAIYQLYSAPRIQANAHGAYDPLWAQLSDLYGNIGTTSRISRTIVVGSNGSFVRRLLFILSYFIRCNEVFQRTTEFKEDPDSLLNPLPPTPRSTYDLPEDHESGSPATMMRSISIPKRPRIDTFSVARASSISRGSLSSRLTAINEPTTPVLPHHPDRDRPTTPTVPRRPLIDTTRPRIETKDSISSGSTPLPSQPTTPTTIESRADSDRASATGEENGYPQQPQPQYALNQLLRVDTLRSRTLSSDTVGTEASAAVDDSESLSQDVLTNVPLPVSRVVCTFPPFPSTTATTSTTSNTSTTASSLSTTTSSATEAVEDKVLPANVLFCKSYGRSLMAPYVDRYMSDFALMGVPKFDFQHFMETDMRDTMRHFEIQERVASTVCIVADTNTMKCNVFCAKPPPPLPAVLDSPDARGGLGGLGIGGVGGGGGGGLGVSLDLRGEPVTRLPHTSASVFVDETLHRMIDMSHNGVVAEQCLNYLEVRLTILYKCSQLLSSLARDKDMLNAYPTLEAMAPVIGLHRSDMPLVLAVCSTYDELVVNTLENT